MAPFPHLTVVNADILRLSPLELLSRHLPGPLPPYKVVANLPYLIASPALRLFLEADHKPQRMVVMLQKEVAQRMVAQPGNMSLLSVSVQFYGRPRIVAYVPPRSFYPSPKVTSAILAIDPHPQLAVAPDGVARFFAVVRAGFSAPRKQIHNALCHGLGLEPNEAAAMLHQAAIDARRRAESLSLAEWGELYQAWTNMRE